MDGRTTARGVQRSTDSKRKCVGSAGGFSATQQAKKKPESKHWRFICTVRQIKFWQDLVTWADLKRKHSLFTFMTLANVQRLYGVGAHRPQVTSAPPAHAHRLRRQSHTNEPKGKSGSFYKTQIDKSYFRRLLTEVWRPRGLGLLGGSPVSPD